jgi:hypothetical protein
MTKKLIVSFFLMGAFCLISGAYLLAQPTAGTVLKDLRDFEKSSETVSNVTGLAASPGLMLFGSGLYHYLKTEQALRPWYASEIFLIVLGLILALFLSKDFLPIGPVKKPLYALEEILMVSWGLLGLAVSIPGLESIPILENLTAVLPWTAQTAWAADSQSTIVSGFITPVTGFFIYIAVWCVSNTINILCLLAPSFVAIFLKGFRVTILGSLLAFNAIHPVLGLIFSLLIILGCLIFFRWSFRLTVWGILFSFDLLLRRWRKKPLPGPVPVFAGPLAAKELKIPKRTYGSLKYIGGVLTFSFRRFLIFKKQVCVPGPLHTGRNLLWPTLSKNAANGPKTFFNFRLCHKTHESFLTQTLGTQGIVDLGIRQTVIKAKDWIMGFFRGRDDVGQVI